MSDSQQLRDARAYVHCLHTVIDFDQGTVYDDRAASAAPRRTGHRGKAVARPAARRVKSTRGSPDDDPEEPEPPRPDGPVDAWLWDLLVAHKPGAVR